MKLVSVACCEFSITKQLHFYSRAVADESNHFNLMVIKIGLARYSNGGELVRPPELFKPCLTTLALLLPTIATSVILAY